MLVSGCGWLVCTFLGSSVRLDRAARLVARPPRAPERCRFTAGVLFTAPFLDELFLRYRVVDWTPCLMACSVSTHTLFAFRAPRLAAGSFLSFSNALVWSVNSSCLDVLDLPDSWKDCVGCCSASRLCQTLGASSYFQ